MGAATAAVALALWFGVLRGSDDENAPSAPSSQTAATATPLSLTAVQDDALLDESGDFLRLTASLFSDVIGCARTGGGPECVRPAVADFEASARSMRRTVVTLANGVEGNCAAFLRGIDEPLDAVVEAVRSVSDAARSGDFEKANALADDASGSAEKFGEAVGGAQTECAPPE